MSINIHVLLILFIIKLLNLLKLCKFKIILHLILIIKLMDSCVKKPMFFMLLKTIKLIRDLSIGLKIIKEIAHRTTKCKINFNRTSLHTAPMKNNKKQTMKWLQDKSCRYLTTLYSHQIKTMWIFNKLISEISRVGVIL